MISKLLESLAPAELATLLSLLLLVAVFGLLYWGFFVPLVAAIILGYVLLRAVPYLLGFIYLAGTFLGGLAASLALAIYGLLAGFLSYSLEGFFLLVDDVHLLPVVNFVVPFFHFIVSYFFWISVIWFNIKFVLIYALIYLTGLLDYPLRPVWFVLRSFVSLVSYTLGVAGELLAILSRRGSLWGLVALAERVVCDFFSSVFGAVVFLATTVSGWVRLALALITFPLVYLFYEVLLPLFIRTIKFVARYIHGDYWRKVTQKYFRYTRFDTRWKTNIWKKNYFQPHIPRRAWWFTRYLHHLVKFMVGALVLCLGFLAYPGLVFLMSLALALAQGLASTGEPSVVSVLAEQVAGSDTIIIFLAAATGVYLLKLGTLLSIKHAYVLPYALRAVNRLRRAINLNIYALPLGAPLTILPKPFLLFFKKWLLTGLVFLVKLALAGFLAVYLRTETVLAIFSRPFSANVLLWEQFLDGLLANVLDFSLVSGRAGLSLLAGGFGQLLAGESALELIQETLISAVLFFSVLLLGYYLFCFARFYLVVYPYFYLFTIEKEYFSSSFARALMRRSLRYGGGQEELSPEKGIPGLVPYSRGKGSYDLGLSAYRKYSSLDYTQVTDENPLFQFSKFKSFYGDPYFYGPLDYINHLRFFFQRIYYWVLRLHFMPAYRLVLRTRLSKVFALITGEYHSPLLSAYRLREYRYADLREFRLRGGWLAKGIHLVIWFGRFLFLVTIFVPLYASRLGLYILRLCKAVFLLGVEKIMNYIKYRK